MLSLSNGPQSTCAAYSRLGSLSPALRPTPQRPSKRSEHALASAKPCLRSCSTPAEAL
jgi:hypothetical protein